MNKWGDYETFVKEMQSEIDEKMYDIPDNWMWTKLKFLLENIQIGSHQKGFSDEKGTKYLRIKDLHTDNIEWSEALSCNVNNEYLERYKLEDEDVVIVRIGSFVGESYLLKDPPMAIFSSNLIRIRLSDMITLEYFLLFLKSKCYWYQINSILKKRGEVLTIKSIGEINIPLPPLQEQRRIGKKLKEVFKKINEAQQLITAVKDSLENNNKNMLQKFFGKRITHNLSQSTIYNKSEKLNISELGKDLYKATSNWKWIEIQDVFMVDDGEDLSDSILKYSDRDVLWGIKKEMNKNFFSNTKEYVVKNEGKNPFGRLIREKTIALVVRGGILKNSLPVAFVHKPHLIDRNIKVLDSKVYEVNMYMFWYIYSHQEELLRKYCNFNTSVPYIKIQDFLKHKIPLPSYREMKVILESIDALITKQEKAMSLINYIDVTKIKQEILDKGLKGGFKVLNFKEENLIKEIEKIVINNKFNPFFYSNTKSSNIMNDKELDLLVLLKKIGNKVTAESLWRQSRKDIITFYRELRDYIGTGEIVESDVFLEENS
ncbi:hypothetical protein CON74_25645 [Bacillus thuringiensis]|uniref:restriction endonuclease subunit S n=1 Tax=Bacillus thuringiensis TaxID=1428 RepID=UPI000BED6543|nr:restriction endonuclease subunit S [Bacillus thuringiensis]PEA58041.1 hypothetical protein CON74_25645 [Bacillus thuringiensis]HDR8143066.1 restriction endonuclease subunit S [Bacillus cereus]